MTGSTWLPTISRIIFIELIEGTGVKDQWVINLTVLNSEYTLSIPMSLREHTEEAYEKASTFRYKKQNSYILSPCDVGDHRSRRDRHATQATKPLFTENSPKSDL